jgi:hypothetical protein
VSVTSDYEKNVFFTKSGLSPEHMPSLTPFENLLQIWPLLSAPGTLEPMYDISAPIHLAPISLHCIDQNQWAILHFFF